MNIFFWKTTKGSGRGHMHGIRLLGSFWTSCLCVEMDFPWGDQELALDGSIARTFSEAIRGLAANSVKEIALDLSTLHCGHALDSLVSQLVEALTSPQAQTKNLQRLLIRGAGKYGEASGRYTHRSHFCFVLSEFDGPRLTAGHISRLVDALSHPHGPKHIASIEFPSCFHNC